MANVPEEPQKDSGRTSEKLTRFSVTMPESLVEEFEQRIKLDGGRDNRSEALRSLVRRYIAEERWQTDTGEIYGSVTLVYDHHVPSLMSELTNVQHDHGEVILCSTHVHVDHGTCLECIILKGSASRVQKFIEALRSVRGIKSLNTVITSGA